MAQTTIVQLGGNGSVPADTAATANTLAMRDNSGNVAGAQVAGTELKTTGILTLQTSAKTANFTADTSATVYLVSAAGGAVTAALPSAVGITGRVYTFTKTDASGNAVTVTGAVIAISLATQGAFKSVISDGATWQLIA